MLRGAVCPVQTIAETDFRERIGVVAKEAVGWNFDGEGVAARLEIGHHFQIFGRAEAVGVLVAESRDLSSIMSLMLDGKKDEVVAKAGDDRFALEIARIDKDLEAVPFAEIGLANFLERDLHFSSNR